MELKSTKVYPAHKSALEDLKYHLGMKSEAEVIGYLIEHYSDRWTSITMKQDRTYRENVQEQKRQMIIGEKKS